MPYGTKGELLTPPFTRQILIITVWDAVALLWKYIISQPPRKKFVDQVAYLKKMQCILVDKILEMGGEEEACPTTINLTLSIRGMKIKNYFFGASLRGRYGA